MISLRQNKSFLKIMENYCIDTFAKLFEFSPEFKEMVKEGKVVEIVGGSDLDTAVDAACQIFEIAYSKKYVSQLMDVLLKSPQGRNRDYYIFKLLAWTEYVPEKEQEPLIRNIFNNTEVEMFNNDYDVFMRDKQRIAEERRNIKEGNIALASTFNF